MKIPADKNSILREYPDTMKPFMRFQIGFIHMREVMNPDSGRSLGHQPTFYLCGFGETQIAAEKMAGIKIRMVLKIQA